MPERFGGDPAPFDELDKRLDALPPIVDEMRKNRISTGALRRAGMYFPTLEFDRIRTILFRYADRDMQLRWLRSRLPSPNDLRRQEKTLVALLKQNLLPAHRATIASVHLDLQMLIPLQMQRARRATCPAVSSIITDLMTYFLHCQELCLYSESDLYRFVGNFIEQLSKPSCLMCGRKHALGDFRRVRMRDALRREPREQRMLNVMDDAIESTLLEHDVQNTAQFERANERKKQLRSGYDAFLDWLAKRTRTGSPHGPPFGRIPVRR